MTKIAHDIAHYVHEHITGTKAPSGFLPALTAFILLLAIGTTFYSAAEGWSSVDALYFSFITLATIGYGDLYPTTTISKIFTMVYIVFGVGLGLYVLTTFATSLIEGRKKREERLKKIIKGGF